ncbi:DNA mismatch repair protein MutS [Brockia lithotrophica]|uniref:DNA mismatch repair protein MutS n=1 Tax=Brockia lithotrophica TaxID=933949 RepID=A0A660L4Q6_9BACL|nr:DNA mismatch repair protein MutS [Brockia lithotrophica]RKQ88398.1 DNA mismatch repair protein MutS [Brockia lithotrophica]
MAAGPREARTSDKLPDPEAYTPMFRQYLEIKRQVPDMLLFFRLGDFYELFFEDAEVVSRELGLTLTGRDGGSERVPMCGVPYHSADQYLRQLLEKGYRVAICEQMEDPKTAKGLVRREITRILTPGTLLEEPYLTEDNRFLAAVVPWDLSRDAGSPERGRRTRGRGEGEGAKAYGFAFLDVSTGEGYALVDPLVGESGLEAELAAVSPREVLLAPEVWEDLEPLVRRFGAFPTLWQEEAGAEDPGGPVDATGAGFFGASGAGGSGEGEEDYLRSLVPDTPGYEAARRLVAYVRRVSRAARLPLRPFVAFRRKDAMVLDAATRRSLELFETERRRSYEGSLLWLLDETRTPMGRRLLRRFLERPLVDPGEIRARLAAVRTIKRLPLLREGLRELLARTYDIERPLSRLYAGGASGKDLARLRDTLRALPHVRALLLESLAGEELPERFLPWRRLDLLDALRDLLERALVDDPPFSLSEGGVIRPGYDAELDRLRALQEEGTARIARLEEEERRRTGIRSLKIGYNRVFGYYIEVTRPNLHLVPPHYRRRQTLAGAERFDTEELKRWEEEILTAEERARAREAVLLEDVRNRILEAAPRLRELAGLLAELDVFQALATVADRRGYVEPEFSPDGSLYIRAGRHPVLEALMPPGAFVPNDAALDDEVRILLITGPNMAGKSTYMRQVALIQLLFQMGSFVPAEAARLPVVDRIFTRIGAGDDLAAGDSTFMVEMKEVRTMLREATPKSLLLVDELGRGTSTEDGLAIAQATIEYIHDKIGAKALISTHFHELAELEGRLPRLRNVHLEVKERADGVVFTRRLRPGAASRSYGIYVARLAGIPEEVIRRAERLARLYGGKGAAVETLTLPLAFADETSGGEGGEAEGPEGGLAPCQDPADLPERDAVRAILAFLREIEELDVDRMTPIQALNTLAALRRRLREHFDALAGLGGVGEGLEKEGEHFG